MKKLKKCLALALAMCMLMSFAVTAPAFAAGDGVFRDTCAWPPVQSYVANYFNANGVGWQIGMLTYEGLFCYIAVSGVYIPRIAESYVQEDMKDTITLRKDAMWNDGQPVTSKDIWAYYVLNNTNAVTKELASIETPDDYTVVFNWRNKINEGVRIRMIATNYDASIPYHIYSEYVDKAAELMAKGVETEEVAERRAFGLKFDEDTLAQIDANWKAFINYGPDNKVPIGSGAYMVSKMTDTDVVMTVNPYYYNKDKIGFTKIHFQNVDANTRQAMLQEGQLDRSDGTPPKDVLEGILAANPNLVHYMTLDNASVGIAINVQADHLKEAKFRQAIAYVLDREKIRDVSNAYGITTPYASLGMPLSYAKNEGWVSEEVLNSMTQFSCDLDKATALLTEIGYTKDGDVWKDANGEAVKFTMISTNEFQFLNAAQVACQQLTAFGLETELKVLEANIFSQMYTATGGEKEYDFACNWIDNCWGLYCPYGPLATGYYVNGFAATAGNFPLFTEGSRKDEINMVYPDQSGTETDIGEVLKSMLPMSDEEMVDAASRIAYITNENVFSIAFFQNSSGIYLNMGTIDGIPLMEDVEAQNRNVMIPEDPEKLATVNAHWYLWVGQGLQLASGEYQPK